MSSAQGEGGHKLAHKGAQQVNFQTVLAKIVLRGPVSLTVRTDTITDRLKFNIFIHLIR